MQDRLPEEEQDALLELLTRETGHPNLSDLIYFENLSPEEVLERALAYRPIELG
ncbi:MAG: hypothetical protein U0414_22000 [Polyangiaceae bacterium]